MTQDTNDKPVKNTDNSAKEEKVVLPPDLNTFVWTALNPFEEETSFLLLTPGSEAVGEELRVVADSLGLQRMDSGSDIPWVGTDHLAVALRGAMADLWTGDHSWVRIPTSDTWTGNAIARRYIVLTVGTRVTGDAMDAEEISAYLQGEDVFAGLVKIRLRVTDQ